MSIRERHYHVKGICYVKRVTEEYVGRCPIHNPPKPVKTK